MKKTALNAISTIMAMAIASSAFAHGDEPHHKCKKGYVLTSDHKCMKKP